MAPASLSLRALTRHFPGAARPAVDALSLDVHSGELLAVLGASGAGKTTALRIVAGYDRPDAGSVHVADAGGALRDVTAHPPERRGVGMVFQHGALFPHLTVAGNVAFGLAARGVSRHVREDRVGAALAGAGLEALAERDVRSLSGGEQQRVALARSLAVEPAVLLLDEPLSSLDAERRVATRDALAAALRRSCVTTLLVTHDRDDAFAIADRVAVLHDGRLLQVDTPERLYDAPLTRTVALRTGRATLLPARRDAAGARVTVGGVVQRIAVAVADASASDGPLLAVLRPEMLALAETADAWRGTIAARRFTGHGTTLRVALADGVEIELDDRGRGHAVGDRVAVRIVADAVPLVPDGRDRSV